MYIASCHGAVLKKDAKVWKFIVSFSNKLESAELNSSPSTVDLLVEGWSGGSTIARLN